MTTEPSRPPPVITTLVVTICAGPGTPVVTTPPGDKNPPTWTEFVTTNPGFVVTMDLSGADDRVTTEPIARGDKILPRAETRVATAQGAWRQDQSLDESTPSPRNPSPVVTHVRRYRQPVVTTALRLAPSRRGSIRGDGRNGRRSSACHHARGDRPTR